MPFFPSPIPVSTSSPLSRPLRLGINGYGRIGRCFLRALYEREVADRYQVVAINEPADRESIAYLTRFDSTHGRFPVPVALEDEGLMVGRRRLALCHATEPEEAFWKEQALDLVVECSGRYGQRRDLQRFIAAGNPRLLLSHPGQSAADVDATVVFGINQNELNGRETIVSNASCTTNAVVPVLERLHQAVGVEHVVLTTLHSVMNDQPLIDGYHHPDLRRTRSAMQSIIPVSTGLARGVERLLPALAGRVQAKAIRVPTTNVSAIDVTLTAARDVTAAEINQILAEAAAQGPLAGLLDYTDEPHASVDFNHDPHSAIVDGSQTRASGPRLINLLLWFDNEWGFANRMVDVLQHWSGRW